MLVTHNGACMLSFTEVVRQPPVAYTGAMVCSNELPQCAHDKALKKLEPFPSRGNGS